MFTNDVSEEISTQPSNHHVKFSSITVVHHLQINPNSNWVFFLFYVSSSSRKDRKSAPLRILSSLCVFNRNRHWDESKRRWIGMKKEKKYFGNWKKHSSVANKKRKFFLKKRRYDKMWHPRKKIPFHNVSRQKIIGCLRNEFNWKLKSNKTYNSIDDMDLLNCLPK